MAATVKESIEVCFYSQEPRLFAVLYVKVAVLYGKVAVVYVFFAVLYVLPLGAVGRQGVAEIFSRYYFNTLVFK